MLQEFLQDTALRAELDRAIVLIMLTVARIAPIIQLTPYLGGKAVPPQVKIALSLFMAMLVYPLLLANDVGANLATQPMLLALLTVKELLLGTLLGFCAALAFDAVRLAGQIMDTVRGQNMATAMVPQLPERVSISADILFQLTLICFIAAGGHRLFIATLVTSFSTFPPDALPAWQDASWHLATGLVRLSADAISLGVLLAFPIIAATLLVDMCLGLVNKAAPQIQVFFLGMPIKALVGVAVLIGLLDQLISRTIDEAAAGIAFIQTALITISSTGVTP
jgi:flagellar biosynthetic protein FliR